MPQPRIYEGCNFFRQRIVLATLSGCPVKIKNIRADDDNPGVREFEASFIRLVDKLTNGSRIEVNETGTTLTYHPGLITGGEVEHDCNLQRGIGYYLEPLIALAPFAKKPFHLTLRGVTNGTVDPSVDVIHKVTLPLLRKFMIDEGLELKVMRRGAPPAGGGEVLLTCRVVRQLRAIKLLEPGCVKSVRGLAYALRMAPAAANRVVEGSRAVLDKFLKDVYIFTDHRKGQNAGKSPGYGVSLVAQTTEGVLYSAEAVSDTQGASQTSLPEDIGHRAAQQLVEEIRRGGCVDSLSQSLALLFMALSPHDASQIRLGELTAYTIEYLRHMRDFLQVVFKIETWSSHRLRKHGAMASGAEVDDKEEPLSTSYVLSCKGIGYTNLSKTTR